MQKSFWFRWIFLVLIIFSICFCSKIFINKQPINSKLISSKFISYIDHGNRNRPEIALTFDADLTLFMEQELKAGKVKSFYNQKVIEILEREKIPATIFMTGLWAQNYPQISKELAQNPLFEIGSHSYSHPGFTNNCFGLPSIPNWGRAGEFQKSQDTLKQITGVTPELFRFPGGCHADADVKLANTYGLTVVGWDNASTDSFNQNLTQIVSRLKTKTQNGSIILFHLNGDKNAPQTAQALEQIIPFLKQQGFQFVKVSHLLQSL